MKNISFLVIISTILFACKPAPEKILIKLNKDQQYEQRLVVKSTVNRSGSGLKMNISTVSQVVSHYKVLAVEDSMYTFQVTYQSMTMNIEVDSGLTYQLKSPTTEVFEKLKGHSYKMRVSNTGRVEKVTGADALFSKITATVAGLTGEKRAALLQDFVNTYGDSAIKSNSFITENVYPQKLVRESDSWVIRRAAGGTLSSPAIDAVYKMNQITGQEYVVSIKAKLSLGSQVKTDPLFGLSMSGTMDATNKIDKGTGLITSSKIKQDMSGKAEIVKGTPALIGEFVLMQIKNETTITNVLH